MDLSEVSELVFYWQVLHSDVDFIVDPVVVGIHFTHQFKGYFVEDWQDEGGFLSQPDSKGGELMTQVVESHFQTLLVVQTHLMDSVFIHYCLLLVSELSQE